MIRDMRQFNIDEVNVNKRSLRIFGLKYHTHQDIDPLRCLNGRSLVKYIDKIFPFLHKFSAGS